MSLVVGTPRELTQCPSDEHHFSSSSEEVYHQSLSSPEEPSHAQGAECPPSTARTPLATITNNSNAQSIILEWDGSNPDAIVKRLKAFDKDQLKNLGIREFYKSYGSWDKMTIEQKNKVVSYFCALLEEIQGLYNY